MKVPDVTIRTCSTQILLLCGCWRRGDENPASVPAHYETHELRWYIILQYDSHHTFSDFVLDFSTLDYTRQLNEKTREKLAYTVCPNGNGEMMMMNVRA